MSEATNYARHVSDKLARLKRGTGAVVFFRDEPPMPESEWKEWAFFRDPNPMSNHPFSGRLVGEDADMRCKRMNHRPQACESCRMKLYPPGGA